MIYLIRRSFLPFVIRREMVVAQSGGFSEIERVGFEMAVLKQRKIDGERRVFQKRSVGLHSTEKEFLCV